MSADRFSLRVRGPRSPRPKPGFVAATFGGLLLALALSGCGELQPVEFTRKSTTTVDTGPTVPEEEFTPTTQRNMRPARYEVQAGDTMGSIATEFGLTIDALLEANNLDDPNRLEAGTMLRIPGPNTTTPPPWLQRGSTDRTR